jgi:hypothetical protein
MLLAPASDAASISGPILATSRTTMAMYWRAVKRV